MTSAGIDPETLIARLVEGQGAGIAVLTPNSRLARSLEAEVDARHLAAGRASWEAPDVLPFATYVERCHEEALYSPSGANLPALLSDAAAAILWEEAIRASDWREKLLSVPGTAAMAAQAWSVAHDWRIEGAIRGERGSEDAEAFAQWAEHYRKRTEREGLTDGARLPSFVSGLIAQGFVTWPATLVVYAFDLLTPRQSDFLDACERAGIEVLRCDAPQVASRVRRAVLESPRQELEHAARWARARLEAAGEGPRPRIALVVPELEKRRREVARVFSRVFAPRGTLPGQAHAPLFNLSLGEPLDAFPIVDAALAILELGSGPVDYDQASRLLRSPFLEGAEAEHSQRARLDAALRRIAPAKLTAKRMRTLVPEATHKGAPDCTRFVRLLDRMAVAAQESSRAPAHEWARRFTRMLDAAGFPGERTLDSVEYQALEKWREVLATLAALGLVAPGWSGAEARSRLQRLCRDTVFQPKSGDAPVQVLGILESVGLAFDHLWVSGLTEDAWPLAANPQPLIAPALQRKAGIPQASPEKSLEFDRAITLGWKGAAAEVVFSSARADGDRELIASPLITDIAAEHSAALGIPDFPLLRDALFKAGRTRGAVTKRQDDLGPALAAGPAQGGTAILADQAACPFRAFAHYRLDARALERPEPGLGPLERGLLLHAMMAKLWGTLKDQRTLLVTHEAALDAMVAEAAAEAVKKVHDERPGRLEGRFAQLERERLAAIAHEWLAIERDREPFTVTMREEKIPLYAGDLAIQGRIDRIDHLEGGGLAVIDYKSGRVNVAAWMGERPDDAQLPLYALAAGEGEVRVVAFAKMKTGDRAFVGVARDGGEIPGIDALADHRTAKKFAKEWPELFAMWRTQVESLGEGFANGDAIVDPKRKLATCERCDLKALCRVHERLSALAEDGEERE